MNQRIKKLWIKALRSGKFKQAKEALRVGRGTNAGYCCLGVLETIRCKEKGIEFRNTDGGELSPAAVKWAEVPDSNPDVGKLNGDKVTLAYLNDQGYDFNFIADRVEKYL